MDQQQWRIDRPDLCGWWDVTSSLDDRSCWQPDWASGCDDACLCIYVLGTFIKACSFYQSIARWSRWSLTYATSDSSQTTLTPGCSQRWSLYWGGCSVICQKGCFHSCAVQAFTLIYLQNCRMWMITSQLGHCIVLKQILYTGAAGSISLDIVPVQNWFLDWFCHGTFFHVPGPNVCWYCSSVGSRMPK